MHNVLRLAVPVLLMALVACQSTAPNRGRSGGRLDPTHDAASEVGVRDLRSQDLVTATDRMAESIARRLDVSRRDSPPRIFVGDIENRTTRPEQNYQVFLDRLRSTILATGPQHGLDFRRERAFVEEQRAREFGYDDPVRAPDSYRSQAEYVLTAVVSDLPRGGTNYFLVEYQLVQLVDRAVSGPDLGPGAIVWGNFYEVKFQ